MAILVLAPTLKTPSGHDHAFCTELIRYAGASDVKVLASNKFQPEPELPARPFFSVDPYEYRWIHREAKRPVPWKTLLRSAVRDLEEVDFSSYNKLILHTADPIHLAALSQSLRRFRGILYLGFMLPPTFWLRPTIGRRILSVLSDLAIGWIKRKTTVVLYSETGSICFDHRSVNCLLKLPPVQSFASSVKPPLAESGSEANERIKIGFFGAPFEDKGFQILLELAQNAEVQNRFQIKVFLPPGQEELVDEISGPGDTIVATSEERDLATYFECMSSVDLVYTLYSPLAYKDRMSGIVQDALLAGKPLLVTSGCKEMRRFVEGIAPNAYVHADYSVPNAVRCLASSIERLADLSERARAGSEKIRRMKTFEAYFGVGGEKTH
jgi:hypothetical protein